MFVNINQEVLNDIIGKTFKEAKTLYPKYSIRITKIGESVFIGTRDYNLNRLNVELSSEGLPYKVVTLHNVERKVYSSHDDGIILKAHWG